jgi:hypothetical protein
LKIKNTTRTTPQTALKNVKKLLKDFRTDTFFERNEYFCCFMTVEISC